MKYRWAATVALFAASITQVSCNLRDSKYNFNKDADLSHYKDVATQLEYPDVNSQQDSRAINIPSPMDIGKDGAPEYWDMKLEEALQLALANSQVLNDIGGLVIRSPANVNTIHSPAITETDPRFGVEAALSAFDTSFSYRAFFEKNDRALNNVFFGGGTRLLQQDLGTFQAQLQKRSATGGTFTLRNNTEYDANNAPGNLFPSAWNTNIETEFRQPLLQGAGQEFNRIQGPNSVLGLPSGLLIARVNTDVSLADFEAGLRDLVSNVENAYWDLYFAYRDLDAKITARESALDTWRKIQAAYATGRRRGEAEKEAEAREQYFRFKEEVQNAWSGRLVEGTHTNNGSSGGTLRASGGVRVAERRMRLIMGLPISDVKLIRPADEPRMAKVVFDWDCVLPEALARRVELRRQKWVIKRRELELVAAKNFLLPTLDTVGRYRWRGFGHDLLNPDRQPDPFDNAWQNLTSGNFQEWQLGAELNIPLGFRKGHAGVRNAQLMVARERAVLNQQEREIAHDLSNQLAEVERAYEVTQTNYNRRAAAHEQLAAMNAAYEARNVDLDLVLNAQLRVADSDSRFFAALVEYGLAVKNLHYEKGSLLDYNEVYLAEGPWPDKAYNDAAKRESLMSKPWRLSYILQRPPLVSKGPVAQQTALAPTGPGVAQPSVEVLPDAATQPADSLPAPNMQNGSGPGIQNAPAPSNQNAPGLPAPSGAQAPSNSATMNRPATFVAPSGAPVPAQGLPAVQRPATQPVATPPAAAPPAAAPSAPTTFNAPAGPPVPAQNLPTVEAQAAPPVVAPRAPTTFFAPAGPPVPAQNLPTVEAQAAPPVVAPRAPTTFFAPAGPPVPAQNLPTVEAQAAPPVVAPRAPTTFFAPAGPPVPAQNLPTVQAQAAPPVAAPRTPMTSFAPAGPPVPAQNLPTVQAQAAPPVAAPRAPTTFFAPAGPPVPAQNLPPVPPATASPAPEPEMSTERLPQL